MVGKSSTSYRKATAIMDFEFPEDRVAISSLCSARQKISWSFFRRLLHLTSKLAIDELGSRYLWNNRPIYAIDGTKLNLPRSLKKLKYKGTHKGCFYPQGMLTSLVLLKANIPCNFVFARKTSELASVREHLKHVKKGGVVSYDRLYFTKNTLVAHSESNIDAVFRLKTKTTLKEAVNFIESNEIDTVVRVQREGLDIKIRFVRYAVSGNEYYLATTLLDKDKYPISALKGLYHKRWGIEESYKHLKKECYVEEFHSRKPQGVKQEIGVAMILNLINHLAKLGSTRKKQISLGVSNHLFQFYLSKIWTKTGLVRKQAIEDLLRVCHDKRCQSPPERSFPRRSRKVINRWQRSIAKEWDKKKRQERRALKP